MVILVTRNSFFGILRNRRTLVEGSGFVHIPEAQKRAVLSLCSEATAKPCLQATSQKSIKSGKRAS